MTKPPRKVLANKHAPTQLGPSLKQRTLIIKAMNRTPGNGGRGSDSDHGSNNDFEAVLLQTRYSQAQTLNI